MENSNLNDSQTKEINIATEAKRSVVAGEEIELDIDTEVEADKKTNKFLNKKLAIGIICIIAMVICVFVYCIFVSKSKVEDNEDGIIDESNLVSKVGETYEGLNYSMEKESLAEIGFFYNYAKNLEGKKIDVSYIKVGGLKDTALEDKINEELKSVCESMYDEKNIQDDDVLYDHIYNYTDVYIFNNVLSTMYCEEKCDVDGNITYKYKGVNINLRDFEVLNINQVFTNTTNVADLIGINSLQDIVFSVSPKNLYVVENNKIKVVNLYENRDKVAIFKRFNESKKLFNVTYNASPYIYTTKKFDEADIYGLDEDNLFIDTCNLLENSNYNEQVIEQAKNAYKEAINRARNISYASPSKRFLIQIIPQIKDAEDKLYSITVKINVYEIEKQFFNEHIEEFVVASENKEDKEISVANYFSNAVLNGEDYLKNISSETITRKVDDTGKEIKNSTGSQNINMGIS